MIMILNFNIIVLNLPKTSYHTFCENQLSSNNHSAETHPICTKYIFSYYEYLFNNHPFIYYTPTSSKDIRARFPSQLTRLCRPYKSDNSSLVSMFDLSPC